MRHLALLVVVLSGCQCLVPVEDLTRSRRRDGGTRTDAGVVDAGFTTQACTKPSDCVGPLALTRWCAQLPMTHDAGFSCLDHKCVAECGDQAGSTCGFDQKVGCLVCPAGASCIPPDCGGNAMRFRVEDIACVGNKPFEAGTVIDEAWDGGECPARFRFLDGGLFGELLLQDARGLSLESDVLGGACFAYELPTGAQRLLFSCPRCQVVLGP